MKYPIIFINFCFFVNLAFGSGVQENFDTLLSRLYRNTVPTISTYELSAQMNSGKEMIILDTRSMKEFDISHIKNAVFINYKKPDLDFLTGVSKQTQIIVYCTVGYRSERIGEFVAKLEFKQIYNLYGGLTQWVNDGYPVYDNHGKTKKIHGYSEEWAKWIQTGDVIY